MNDNEENGEVHPLDQEYSETDVRQPTQFRLPDGRLLRAGSIIFVSGLFLVIVSSVCLGVFRPSREIEIGGGYVHRVAMLMILGGGVLFLIACRLKLAGKMSRNSANGTSKWWKVGAFLTANLIALPLLHIVVRILDHLLPSDFADAAFGIFPTAIMVIAAMGCVVHRGWLRGYFIGVLIALLSLSRENDAIERSWVLMRNHFKSYGLDRDGWLFGPAPFADIVLMIEVCGLLGVAYALLFEKRSSDKRQIQQIDEP